MSDGTDNWNKWDVGQIVTKTANENETGEMKSIECWSAELSIALKRFVRPADHFSQMLGLDNLEQS